MTRGTILAGIGMMAVAVAGSAAAPKKASPAASPNAVQALVQSCEAHKFETMIQLPGEDGKPRSSRVKLCGNQGQSDADWIRTLKDAVAKATASPDMPKAAKDQIVTAINAEIERLSAAAPSPTETATREPPSSPEAPLSRDYASLPPLPGPTEAAPPRVLLPPSGETDLAAIKLEPGSKGERGVPTTTSTSAAMLPATRLHLRCAMPSDPDRPGICDIIEPSTLLVVRADAAIPAGMQLRFVRRGTLHGELAVPALRQGQTATLRLPADVCAGVARSRVSIEAGGGTLGEYELRC